MNFDDYSASGDYESLLRWFSEEGILHDGSTFSFRNEQLILNTVARTEGVERLQAFENVKYSNQSESLWRAFELPPDPILIVSTLDPTVNLSIESSKLILSAFLSSPRCHQRMFVLLSHEGVFMSAHPDACIFKVTGNWSIGDVRVWTSDLGIDADRTQVFFEASITKGGLQLKVEFLFPNLHLDGPLDPLDAPIIICQASKEHECQLPISGMLSLIDGAIEEWKGSPGLSKNSLSARLRLADIDSSNPNVKPSTTEGSLLGALHEVYARAGGSRPTFIMAAAHLITCLTDDVQLTRLDKDIPDRPNWSQPLVIQYLSRIKYLVNFDASPRPPSSGSVPTSIVIPETVPDDFDGLTSDWADVYSKDAFSQQLDKRAFIRLRSDIQAFKASNADAALVDFIKWHSPNDWNPETGQLSDRMRKENSVWHVLWNSLEACPAREQRPIVDVPSELEKAQNFIQHLRLLDFANQIRMFVQECRIDQIRSAMQGNFPEEKYDDVLTMEGMLAQRETLLSMGFTAMASTEMARGRHVFISDDADLCALKACKLHMERRETFHRGGGRAAYTRSSFDGSTFMGVCNLSEK